MKQKFCINCKHCSRTTHYSAFGVVTWHDCKALQPVKTVDLVTGIISSDYPRCSVARKTFCGKTPKYFEAK